MRERSGFYPPMPRLLLITGAPASGKTRLAQRLSERYRAAGCSKDEIKEILFDRLGSGDVAWSRRLSDASFALLFAFAARLLAAARPLLLEGNFRPGEHEPPLRALLAGGDVQLAQVLCEAAAATRAARLAARAGDARRHAGHRDATLAVSSGASGFLDLPGPRLRFDSDAPEERQLAALYAALDPWAGCEPCTPVAPRP